jgi:hypothetical protein
MVEPTPKQENILRRTMGCVLLLYNVEEINRKLRRTQKALSRKTKDFGNVAGTTDTMRDWK